MKDATVFSLALMPAATGIRASEKQPPSLSPASLIHRVRGISYEGDSSWGSRALRKGDTYFKYRPDMTQESTSDNSYSDKILCHPLLSQRH